MVMYRCCFGFVTVMHRSVRTCLRTPYIIELCLSSVESAKYILCKGKNALPVALVLTSRIQKTHLETYKIISIDTKLYITPMHVLCELQVYMFRRVKRTYCGKNNEMHRKVQFFRFAGHVFTSWNLKNLFQRSQYLLQVQKCRTHNKL